MYITNLSILKTLLLLAVLLCTTSNAVEAPELTQNQIMDIAYLQSQSRHREAIEYLENHIGKAEPTAGQLFKLSLACVSSGNYGKMVIYFDKIQHKEPDGRVLDKLPFGGIADLTSTAYSVMMRGYAQIGDDEKAIAAGKKSLEYSDVTQFSGKFQAAATLGELGAIYAGRGDVINANEIEKRLLAIPNTPDVGDELERQIGALINSGLFQIYLLEKKYEQALVAFNKTDLPYSPAIIKWYEDQGKSAVLDEIDRYAKATRSAIRANILVELNRLEEAHALYDIAFSHPRLNQFAATYWSTLFNRGRLAEKEGHPTEAIEFYKRAVDAIESQRSSISSEAGKIGFVGNKQDVYGQLIKTLILQKHFGEAFEYVERSKARALVDMMASKEKFERPNNINTTTLQSTLTQLNTDLVLFKPDSATSEQLKKNQHTRALVRKTTEQLQKTDHELASFITVSSMSEANLRQLLQPDETLVEYYYLDNDLYAFVATQSTLRAVHLEGTDLVNAVRNFRVAVQNPKSKDITKLSRELHTCLIAPLNLPAKGKLLIVPHGVLHYLPFNALNNGNDFLIDHYSLRMLPSASVMSFLNQRTSSGNGLIIFGNPDLGDPQYDLPGAQKEAVEIARLHPGATVLMRRDATKTAAINLTSNFAYLHFASHGKFDNSHPLQSGIYLANDQDTGTSGTLTVDELYSLHLNADLVTLSACETGLGNIDNGDDLIGLTRGFFYAGVSSIVSSLWQVDDDATYQTMTKFYAELGHLPKTEALRKAQLAVKAKFPHPYYWAAFQLTGNRE